MDPTTTFRLNEADVVHQPLEDEVIAVNLRSGSYFAVQGSGVDIWVRLRTGATVDDLVRELGHDAVVAAFLVELAHHGLIVPGPADRDPGSGEARVSSRAEFTAPVLEAHDDMQDLLLLDPVHDVDHRGWPHAREP